MSRHAFRSICAVSLLAGITACANAAADQAARLAADSALATTNSRTRSLATGTTLQLVAVTDVTSQKDEAGKPFTARTTTAVLNPAGAMVIPAGAELVGTVTVLQSAPTPGGHGSLEVAFSTLRFGGRNYPIGTRVVSLATRSVARGVTIDDAAKVGVGAAVGAVAGRIIGHNGTGAAVGAAAGGTAGVVYANRTKDHDIVLSPGSAVVVALTSPFSRTITTN